MLLSQVFALPQSITWHWSVMKALSSGACQTASAASAFLNQIKHRHARFVGIVEPLLAPESAGGGRVGHGRAFNCQAHHAHPCSGQCAQLASGLHTDISMSRSRSCATASSALTRFHIHLTFLHRRTPGLLYKTPPDLAAQLQLLGWYRYHWQVNPAVKAPVAAPSRAGSSAECYPGLPYAPKRPCTRPGALRLRR